jgi:pimeloyl-ACP methyl ester carboxylesterase
MTQAAGSRPEPRRATVAGLAALTADPLDTADPHVPTVLLLPGYTGSKEDFAPLLPLLAAAGLRAVAVDQRGQFESHPDPGGPDSQFSLESLAADAALAAAELGSSVHLVGHSFGGLVARASLLGHPQLLASVTFLSSGPSAIGGGRRIALDGMTVLHARGGRAAVWQASRALYTAELTAEQEAFERRRFFAHADRALLVTGQILRDEPDRTREAAAVAAAHGIPLLVTHGVGDDAWLPPQQADMAARLGARYAVIPDALHSAAAQNPTGTAEVLTAFVRDAVARAAAGEAQVA